MAVHKAWRLFIDSNDGDATFTQLNEMEFNLASVDQLGNAGTLFRSSTGGFPDANISDDNLSTTFSFAGGSTTNQYIGKIFTVAIDVDECTMTAPPGTTRMANTGKFQYSDDTTDGTDGTWVDFVSFAGETGWSNEETRSFTPSGSTVTEYVSQDFSYQQEGTPLTEEVSQDFSYQQEAAVLLVDNVAQDFSYQQDAALVTFEHVAQDFSYLQEALIPIVEYVSQDFSYQQEELTLLTDNVSQDFSYLQESAQIIVQSIAQDFSYLQEDSTVTNVALFDSIALTDLGLGFDIIFQLKSAMALQDASLAPANFTVPLQDFIALDDLVNLSLLGTLSDGMSLSDSPEALIQFLATLAEQLSMSDNTLTTAEIVGNLTDAMTLADLILGGLIGDLSESFTLNDQIVEVISAWEAIQEALTISLSSSTGTLIVIGLLTDQLSLDDTLSAGQALQEALKDGIAMMSLPPEISDDGRIGWVMNPETFAVWNYNNMNFNSLTFYQETGLMASSTGLYKSNDSAVDTNTLDPVANPLLVTRITSSLKTPSLNFGTSSLKQVPKMYLGLDMDGEITLVVNTDEKVKVRYQLKKPTDHSHVQEMQIGKGLIGSQWQFELIDSTSDDFELNFIEILPVVFGRKTR